MKHLANNLEFGIFVVGPELVVATVPGGGMAGFLEISFE